MVIAKTDTNYCAIVKTKSMFVDYYWVTSRSGTIADVIPTDAGVTCPPITTVFPAS